MRKGLGRRWLRSGWLMLVALAVGVDAADEIPFVHEPSPISPGFEPRPGWSEELTRLPPLPQAEDLIELRLDGGPGPFRYFIDGRHLAVGEDGVVRYTVVIRSRSGASNLSLEGIRCTARGRFKVFAYGTEQGFIPTDQDWQPIGPNTEPYRIQLWRHHFCLPGLYQPRSVAEIRRSLKTQTGTEPGGLLPE